MATTIKGYTSVGFVRNRAKNIPVSGTLPDDAINEYIVAAEGLIDAVTQTDWKDKFDQVKHRIIQAATTDIAALYAVSQDPSVYTDLAEAQVMMDVLWASTFRALILLSDPRIVEFLKKL